MSSSVTGSSDFRDWQMQQLKSGGSAAKTNNTKGTSWDAVFEEESSSMVSVDDFLTLMVAQLTNQDFMNPVDDTQYVTQLAQFATMQQMQEMAANMKSNYALTLVGKNVTAAKFTVTGGMKTETGIISKISLVDNSYEITVNGETFRLEQIMELNSSATQDKPSEDLSFLMSLMNKEVTVETKDDDGEETKVTGVVEKISTSGGKYQIMIDGEWYDMNDVVEVSDKIEGDADVDTDTDVDTDADNDGAVEETPEAEGENTEGSQE